MVGVAREALYRLPGPPGSPFGRDWFLNGFGSSLEPTPASLKEHSLGHSVYGNRCAGSPLPPLYTKQQQQPM